MTKHSNPHIGSSFDDFLGNQGILEECKHQALKEILADQVRQAMADNQLSKTAMADRMNTSRRQLDRLLDPAVANVTLATMSKAARAVGRELHISLI
jgi:transcriptional regulator GlxA family with amidase domain